LVHVGKVDINISSGRNYASFSRPASSISEVVADLIKESGMRIDEDAATNLIMGVENATDFFSDPSVDADTFATISELMRKGGKRSSRPTYQSQGAAPRPMSPVFPTSKSQLRPAPQNVYGNKNFNQNNKDKTENIPSQSGWMEPKIYKGTSTS
jgi:hypothetical protein